MQNSLNNLARGAGHSNGVNVLKVHENRAWEERQSVRFGGFPILTGQTKIGILVEGKKHQVRNVTLVEHVTFEEKIAEAISEINEAERFAPTWEKVGLYNTRIQLMEDLEEFKALNQD
jgi:hypothetical protein